MSACLGVLDQFNCRVSLDVILSFYQSDLINLIRPTPPFVRLSITDLQLWR